MSDLLEKEIKTQIDEVVERALEAIQNGISSGRGVRYWEAAREALGVLEARSEALADVTKETVVGLLRFTSAGDQGAVVDFIFRQANPTEIIAAMAAGTAALNANTARVVKRNQALAEIAIELGRVGAQLLLALI